MQHAHIKQERLPDQADNSLAVLDNLLAVAKEGLKVVQGILL